MQGLADSVEQKFEILRTKSETNPKIRDTKNEGKEERHIRKRVRALRMAGTKEFGIGDLGLGSQLVEETVGRALLIDE